VRLPKTSIIHKNNVLNPELRSLLVGDLTGFYRIWKYDSHKTSAYKKFANIQILQHHPLQTARNFSSKILGFCKKEKKRTARCGLCLRFDELEYKLEKNRKLDGHDNVDYKLLLRHKVCQLFLFYFSFFISSSLSLSLFFFFFFCFFFFKEFIVVIKEFLNWLKKNLPPKTFIFFLYKVCNYLFLIIAL
jgi:hypothetical protein